MMERGCHWAPLVGSFTLVSCVALLWSAFGCRSTTSGVRTADEGESLPDLRVKKVSYRLPYLTPNVAQQRLDAAYLQYEFELQIENIGNVAFREPFYIGHSMTTADYQNRIYPKQQRCNDERALIAPGKSFVVKFSTTLEIPRYPSPLSNFPVRFLIHHGDVATVVHPAGTRMLELSYENNTYELSMRISVRR